ncbi:MAG: hypothetical protein AAF218_09500 [Pseudomonadota bacterium]
MNADIALVLGIIIGGLSVPSVLSAITDRRAPRASMLTILLAGGLIYYALNTQPGGYTLQDVPDAFVRVVAMVMN